MTDEHPLQQALHDDPAGCALRVKVVPGASRNRIAGLLGDRLKLAVAAPPEQGKANKAVCSLIAKTLGLPPRSVSVAAGQTQPQKTLTVAGLDRAAVLQKLAEHLGP